MDHKPDRAEEVVTASTDRSYHKTVTKTPSLGLTALGRKVIVAALVAGLVGGGVGAYGVIKLSPNVVPVSKQAVVVKESSAVIDVAKKVAPSVVSIRSTTSTAGLFGRVQTGQSAGTGVIISSDGLILTNKHVVPSDNSTFSVIDNDGKEYKDAKVVARDPRNDLAIVKISANGLTAAKLGDSGSVQVGQQVVAIGNALGQYQNTVTDGIISGIGRPVTAAESDGSGAENLQNLFQTDAAINAGNSGGPLVDLQGNVIGINTAVASDAQNVGFSIPINDARTAIDSYKEKGEIVRPYLGVRYVALTSEVAKANDLPTTSGAWIKANQGESAVVEESPAAKAGLKDGDIITKVGGTKVDEKNALSTLIGKYKVGQSVEFTIVRDGKSQTIKITLEQADQEG